MRWRQSFPAQVAETLQQLGLKACPVCGSTEPPDMGHHPTLLFNEGFPGGDDTLLPGEEFSGDLTFAVRVECTTCGHLMLFNAQRYRTGDEKIIEATDDEEPQLGE